MMKKIVSVCLLFSLLTVSAWSSPLDSIGVTKIDGKFFIKYLVSPGETIYGISTKYGVPISDLLEANPELEQGLKVGQVINVLYNKEYIDQQNVKNSDDVIIHKVQPGETLYGLAKKYNTTVAELMRLNNMDLKAGQDLVVGRKNDPKMNQQAVINNNPANNTNTNTNNNTVKPVDPVVVNKPDTDPKNNDSNNNASGTKPKEDYTQVPATVAGSEKVVPYPYDPSRKQVLIIPFDPYLYFSDADDEIAARSNMQRTKVRQVFRRRLNALLDAQGYETIHLLGGRAKDSISDLNKIYSSVSYNYQAAIVTERTPKEEDEQTANAAKTKSWLDKQKDKLKTSGDTKYDVPKDHGNYFGVQIKNPAFFEYFNQKYSVDYYIFVNQFEVKTNYENCLDRAALNYERTFTTHFSIFDSNGKQIAGNKFKTHYNSNSNYVYQIAGDNIPKIAERILTELPKPNE